MLFPIPRDLPDPWAEPISPESPALAGRFFTTTPPGRGALAIEGLARGEVCTRFKIKKKKKLDPSFRIASTLSLILPQRIPPGSHVEVLPLHFQ